MYIAIYIYEGEGQLIPSLINVRTIDLNFSFPLHTSSG